MNRRELMQLCAGILGGLGIPGVRDGVSKAVAADDTNALDESYLAKGLTAMARADGWFKAHWGAAVLAGYYLCRENNLGEETVRGIRNQLDALIEFQAAQFTPLPQEAANEKRIEDIPAALPPVLEGGLRAHGHAVIFTSLSTRALRDAPHLARPTLIDKLCGLSRQIARMKAEKPNGQSTYTDTQAMIEATFDSFVKFKGLLGRPSVRRPNFTHITTHTEALMNLEAMGYAELTQMGCAGHRAHIGTPVPEFDPAEHPLVKNPATLEEIMSQGYWEREENVTRWNKAWNITDNRNGYWVAFGHLFKVLYAYNRLVKRIADQEKIRLCSRILLERYFNPEVQGG